MSSSSRIDRHREEDVDNPTDLEIQTALCWQGGLPQRDRDHSNGHFREWFGSGHGESSCGSKGCVLLVDSKQHATRTTSTSFHSEKAIRQSAAAGRKREDCFLVERPIDHPSILLSSFLLTMSCPACMQQKQNAEPARIGGGDDVDGVNDDDSESLFLPFFLSSFVCFLLSSSFLDFLPVHFACDHAQTSLHATTIMQTARRIRGVTMLMA